MSKRTPMIRCQQVQRVFEGPSGRIHGLRDVTLEIERGEWVVVHGPSGSGKSTLLLTLGGMMHPSSGAVLFDGTDLYALSASARNRLRATAIGFVFQLFHLVPYLTVTENVLAGLPAQAGVAERARVGEVLAQLGLTDRANSHPATLSAGERQRTALARALVKQPRLILADEPTGNLDEANAAIVFEHLDRFRRQGGTVVVVSHGRDADVHATRILQMNAGQLHAETKPVHAG